MFKATRWRSEKNKIKFVFKLEFHATKVTKLGWESAMVSILPIDLGKITSRSEKVTVMDGNCQWRKPIYETVKFIQDPKTGMINDKFYKFIVSATGSAKGIVIGEITINLAEYAEVLKPYIVSLPLKESDSGPILHVSIQKVQTDSQRREANENGGAYGKEEGKISDQLNNLDKEESGLYTIYQQQMSSPLSKTMHMLTGSNKYLRKCNIDTRVSTNVNKSSEQCSSNGNVSYQSPLSIISTQNQKSTSTVEDYRDHQRSFSIASGPEVSTDESTYSLTERFKDSDFELQTLRKQLVKETKHGKSLAQELSKIKEEREAFKRKCENFKGLCQLEEIKQELTYEKNINANLRLQLEKTQESNSELILAVKDLEKVMEQKNSVKFSEIKFRSSDLHIYDWKQELLDTASEEDSEQYALEELVKGHRGMNVSYTLEQQLSNLQSEVDLYKKDREGLEMQMEQLALDYEILKQENHGMNSKLVQSRLREQLRMQYECSAHTNTISELKNEIEKQAEAFEVDLRILAQAKVEQEQRVIQAEEALRILRWNNANKAEQLQKEFEILSLQMASTFHMNEKLAVKALEEASELKLQKCNLENLLAETHKELLTLRKHEEEKNRKLVNEIEMLKVSAEENEMFIQNKNVERDTLEKELEKTVKELTDIQDLMDKKLTIIKTLNSEVGILRAQYNELKNSLFEDEEENENLRKQVFDLRCDLQKKDDSINIIEKKLKECNAKMNTRNKNNVTSNTTKEIATLREKVKLLEGKIKMKDATIEDTKKSFLMKEKDMINKIEELQKSLHEGTAQMKTQILDGKMYEESLDEKRLLQPVMGEKTDMDVVNGSNIEPTNSTFSIPNIQENQPEMLIQMIEIKEKNEAMEAELKEMQERYSEISLKFAEVEGERQQLVMTVRSLKNSSKN